VDPPPPTKTCQKLGGGSSRKLGGPDPPTPQWLRLGHQSGGAIWWTRTFVKGRHGVVCSLNCVIHVWAPWGRDTFRLGRYINPRTFSPPRVARGAGRLMQNKMPITVIWLFLSFLNSSQLLRRRNSTSGFGLGDVAHFRRSKSIKPNFVAISIHGWNITTSGLERLTSVILKSYFRFRFRPYLHNRNVILHQPAKFHRNRVICTGVVTSYQFFAKKYNGPKLADPSMSAYSPMNFRGIYVLVFWRRRRRQGSRATAADYKRDKRRRRRRPSSRRRRHTGLPPTCSFFLHLFRITGV